jgi:hypothetical protein
VANFDFRFERHCRTPNSESYLIKRDTQDVGMVDLHFTTSAVYGTLAVIDGLDNDEIQELIELIDEDLVITADTPRDDFVVSVFQGHMVGVYSDDMLDDDEDEEDELDEQRNGH